MTIIAAADGSALGNPGPAGWAWYIDEATWRAGGWPHGTNNQGELMAVLDLFRATAHRPEEPLQILCDSQYVINCITKWMPGWKRKGWRKADGKPVLNVEMLKEIDAALIGRTYRFEWVKGHAGHELNEAADVRARSVATAYQKGATPEAGPGFPGQDLPATHAAVTGSDVEDRGSAVVLEEPDLFSVLDDEPPVQPDPLILLQGYDQELFGAEASRAAVLLSEGFEEVGANGRWWDREAVLAENGPVPRDLQPLSATVDGDLAVLLYRATEFGGMVLQTSIWCRYGTQWRLRLRQSTPESGLG